MKEKHNIKSNWLIASAMWSILTIKADIQNKKKEIEIHAELAFLP